MRPSTRLIWISMAILMSTLYGVIVIAAPVVASAIMLGYVGMLLSIFILCEVWKKDE